MSLTISKVARLAGVSSATVSRALAHPEKVKAKTRERVLAAVRETGFVPNAQARNLRLQATKTVILLVRDIGNIFYLEIYKGVEEAAIAAGYKVLMGDARDDDARIMHYFEMVRERHADGLILMVGRFPEALRRDRASMPPMVVALETLPELGLPTVRIDNCEAARMAVDHLVGLGHRRIAHISGLLPDPLSSGRLDGYREGLARAGIAFDPGLTVAGDFSLAAGRAAIRALDERGQDYTAVFAASDQMAVGAISELRARGRHTPRDVSVVGFDDILLADAVEPGLTTVHQPRREIGRRVMSLMIAQLGADRDAETDIVLPTKLVLRGSTAPLSQASETRTA